MDAPALQLTISVNTNGSVRVEGPVHEKILCYGMLEAAKDAIKEHHDAIVNGSRIVPAAGPLPPLTNDNGR